MKRKTKSGETVERSEINRLEEMRRRGQEPEIPTCDGFEYMVDALLALPPTRPMAMGGFRGADWPEILAFAQATGRDFDAWEMETLHQMCAAFADGHRRTHALARSPVEIARGEGRP